MNAKTAAELIDDEEISETLPEVIEPAAESDAPESDESEEVVSKPSVLVPKSRYDYKASQAKQLQARNRELEEKLQRYEAEQEKSKDTGPTLAMQISDIDRQIAEARKDGNTDLAFDLMDKKTDLKIQAAAAPAAGPSIDAGQVAEDAVDTMRMDDLLDRLEDEFDMLMPGNDGYDQELVDEIQDLRAAFQARGYGKFDALARAANYVLGSYERAEAPVDTSLKSERRKTDVKKNLAAARRMPPDMSARGLPSDKRGMQDDSPAASRMTDADLEALPDSTKRRMRGDFFGT